MKKWLAVSAAFLAVYLGFVIAFLPASFVFNKIQLPNNIQIGQISGSVWHSKIETLVINKTPVNNIEVTLNWLSIFTLNPSVNITFGGAIYNGPEGELVASGFFADLKITDLKVEVIANDVAQQLPLPIPVQAKNSLLITANKFVLGKPLCQQLLGKVQWRDAAITALSEQVPLGTLSAALTCQKGKVIAKLDEKNDLGVTFTAEIGRNGNASGNGYLTPHSQLPQAIEQVLPFLGRKDKQGRYRLKF